MTAIVLALGSDSLALWTDGAECDPVSYVVTKIRPKPHLWPNLPAVMCSLGCANTADRIAYHHASRWADFDQAVAEMPTALRDARSFVALRLPGECISCQVIFGGWSQSRQCMEGYWLTAWHDRPDDLPTLVPIEGAYLVPGFDADELAASGLPSVLTPDLMPAYFDAARRHSDRPASQPDDAAAGHFVGGFLQLVRLDMTAEGPEIRTSVLRRWPDKIGEPIEPSIEDLA